MREGVLTPFDYTNFLYENRENTHIKVRTQKNIEIRCAEK